MPIPVTIGKYAKNETIVYKFLRDIMNFNKSVACGILANIEQESGFNPVVLGDKNTSIGLCQWHKERADKLMQRSNYQSVDVQLRYLKEELGTISSYKKLLKELNDMSMKPDKKEIASEAAMQWCARFEICEGWGSWTPEGTLNAGVEALRRGSRAAEYFNNYSAESMSTQHIYKISTGTKIVSIAKKCVELGVSYSNYGGDILSNSTLSSNTKTNPAQFIYYCYKEGANISLYNIDASKYNDTVGTLYEECKKNSNAVNKESIYAGDLLFYESNGILYNVAIATGNSTGDVAILVGSDKVIAKSNIGDPKYILRVISTVETGHIDNHHVSPIPITKSLEYSNLTNYDIYSVTTESNFSSLDTLSRNCGYLIDLEHKEEFKFYIPEFNESAGANYNDVNIIGRSVDIKAYNSTKSRSIAISLELFAGAGLYDDPSNKDIVGKLHSDANFVKSLEYPDYDSSAVTSPPPSVQLILGPVLNLVGIVQGVSVSHMKPLDDQNRSMHLKIDFTVVQTAINPPGYGDIRNGNYTLTTTGDLSSLYQEGVNSNTIDIGGSHE